MPLERPDINASDTGNEREIKDLVNETRRHIKSIGQTPGIHIPELKYEGKLEQWKSSFDFQFVQNALDEIAKRCSLQPGQLAIFDATKIKDSNGALGRMDDNKREILINTRKICEDYPEEQQILLFNEILIHEQIHAASSPTKGVAGFVKISDSFAKFNSWNEGVTQMLTKVIAKSYGKSKGLQMGDLLDAYRVQTDFVKLVTRRLSEGTGVSEETVWNAIVRAMFVEHDLEIDDSLGLLPPEFSDKLAWATELNLEQGFENFEGWSAQDFVNLHPINNPYDEHPMPKRKTENVIRKLARRLGIIK